MRCRFFRLLTQFVLLAALPSTLAFAPPCRADRPVSPQKIAAQPNTIDLTKLMPRSIAARYANTTMYVDTAKLDGGVSIGFAFTPDCTGTACSAGQITMIKSDAPDTDGEPIQLNNGITGYYSRGMPTNVIHWHQNGLNYDINFKLQRADLVEYANWLIEETKK